MNEVVLGAVIAFVSGVFIYEIAIGEEETRITKQCDNFGKFEVNGAIYTCTLDKKLSN